ncbi:MAG: alginate export family protein [Deltaproteobacteria bacterium]|nr:alginate export family protein [Deltaproteobacteria bacterium]
MDETKNQTRSASCARFYPVDADVWSRSRRSRRSKRAVSPTATGAAVGLLAAAALLIALAGRASAEDRPAFQGLRFAENWSVLKNTTPATADFFDRIKYIPLAGTDWAWLSLGGQLRERVEAWNGYAFGAPAGSDDDAVYLVSRLLAHGDLHLGSHLRAFVEARSSLATDRDLAGGRRTSEVDEIDLENAFADVAFDVGDAKVTLRGGREEMLLGKERLVSPLDWSNTRRTFEGAAAIVGLGQWNARGFWSRPVVIEKYDFNSNDDATEFYGIYVTHAPAAPGALGFDLYWLGLERDSATFNGTSGKEERHTLGARVGGPIPLGTSDYEVEAAYQFGDVGSADVSAFMVTAQAGTTFGEVTAKPRFEFGVDYASGDDAAGNGTVGTFNQLFPLGHAYLGYIDIVGRQNVIDLRESASCAFIAATTLKLDVHYFLRADDNDALYNAGGAVVRAGNLGSSDEIGTELDFTLKRAFGRHLSALLGYSHLFAGNFIDESGPDKDTDFGYFSIQYTL